MLEDPTLSQVWCETQDDVTLLWMNPSGEEVEFVQVKSNEFDQLWSIAKLLEKEKAKEADELCGADANGHADDNDGVNGDGKGQDESAGANPKKMAKKKVGRCILEKSLQYDRCKEPVRFRVVTSRPIKDELVS